MKKKWVVILLISLLILIGGVIGGPIMSNVEKPKYEVIASQKNIEIRRYNSMIIAEVEVDGTRKDAIKTGFRLLADYIFGNNTVKQDINMTAPVQQQESQKIAMTAPVQQQTSGKLWKISFVMPSEYTINSLPKPNNSLVSVTEIPPQKFIVIQFSGTNSDTNIDKHTKLLMQYIATHHINVIGSPKYAFYNPPWTLPFMRRNEIMMEVN